MSNRPDNSPSSPALSPTYHDFFRCATGGQTPYDYQSRVACGVGDSSAVANRGHRGQTAPQSQLIQIPTGPGKTVAGELAWLWNRVLWRMSRPRFLQIAQTRKGIKK